MEPVVQSNDIVRSAIEKTGFSKTQFFLWCARHLKLETPEQVAARLETEYDAWQPIGQDIPTILDLAFEVLVGRIIPMG